MKKNGALSLPTVLEVARQMVCALDPISRQLMIVGRSFQPWSTWLAVRLSIET